ncbi:MAG: glycosyl hydrolase family 18 protein [Actinomycetota bacterium]|nr:glycosyl hydrolase family 18 protein [Actinomycetota bacterium]
MTEGMRVVDEFPDALTEVNPFWYGVAPDGGVANSPGAENNDVLARIKARRMAIIPTIATAEGPPISAILNDDAGRAAHIEQIMAKVRNPLYDGIDIDYENLPASDKDIFSRFIQELSAKVHEAGKQLVVTVNAKTFEPGNWNGAQSHDYAAIGASADFVRVMAYDQHYAAGPPGPIAAIDWVEKVIAFSLTKIPRKKLILGVPLYGYDWGGAGRARSVVHDEAAAKSLSSQAPIEWDARSASSFFRYNDGSGAHTVWFENSRSLEAKIALAVKYDLAGIAIWRLGREDKTFYQKVRAELSP